MRSFIPPGVFRLLAVVFAVCAAASPSLSQEIDLNAQDFSDRLSTPVEPSLTPGEVVIEIERKRGPPRRQKRRLLDPELTQLEDKEGQKDSEFAALIADEKSLAADGQQKSLVERQRRLEKRGAIPNLYFMVPGKMETITKKVPKVADPMLELSAGLNQDFNSNANFSTDNEIADWLHKRSASANLTIPLNVEGDNVFFAAGVSQGRYQDLTDRNGDDFSATAGYNVNLGAQYLSARGKAGPKTADILSISVNRVNSYTPGFEDFTSGFTKPGITVSRRNIGLTPKLCGTDYCHALTLKLIGNYTIFDNSGSSDNAALTGSAAVTSQTPIQGVTLTTSALAIGRTFPRFEVERQDLTLFGSTTLNWTLNKKATVNVGVKYGQRWATIETTEWENFSFLPAVSATFKF